MCIKFLQKKIRYFIAEQQMKYHFQRSCKYLEYVPLILLHYKKLKTGKILRLKVPPILSAQKDLVTAVEFFLEVFSRVFSVNSEFSNKRNMNFDNKASQILKICPLNITLLLKI